MKKRHRRDDMLRLMEQRAEEELTMKELSERSGIPVSTLGYWSSKFVRERRESEPTLVPVDLVGDGPGDRISIEISGAVRLHVGPGFDAAHLTRLIDVLTARC